MKRMTRRQVAGWFQPIHAALAEMKTGYVDSVRGYAVTRLTPKDDYTRIDFCIAGWSGVLRRIFPTIDLSPMDRIQRMLAAGVPMTESDIDKAIALLKSLETPLVRVPWHVVKDAVTVEMMAIELDDMKVAA